MVAKYCCMFSNHNGDSMYTLNPILVGRGVNLSIISKYVKICTEVCLFLIHFSLLSSNIRMKKPKQIRENDHLKFHIFCGFGIKLHLQLPLFHSAKMNSQKVLTITIQGDRGIRGQKMMFGYFEKSQFSPDDHKM